MIARALLLAAGVIALPAHGAECFTWREAAAPVRPADTTTRPVRKAAKSVHVRRKGKRIKAPTTRPLPRLERVPTECPSREPVKELFLEPELRPWSPRLPLPGFLPDMPMVQFEGPLALIPPGGWSAGAETVRLSPPADSRPVPAPGVLALLLVGAAARRYLAVSGGK